MHHQPTSKTAVIEYPSSDGKPMAESDLHRDWMVIIIRRLARYFAGRRVYVSGNLLIYYQEGDPRKCVAPDTFVVKDCAPGRRETFQIWKEGRVPNAVLETTSKTTRREDIGKKKKIYAALGVGEYFLYDPRGDWLKPPLQGFRLRDGEYEPIPPDADGGIVSQELGIRLVLEGRDLAMFDVATGERLLCPDDWAYDQARRADAEKQRAEQRAEVEKQRAEAEKQRAEAEKQRAEVEKQRAEAEKQRAEVEKQRAEVEKQRAGEAEQRATEAEQRATEQAAARQALEEELARLRKAAKKGNGPGPKDAK